MNTVVLITGASTGFGRAAAETLARRGYTVFATMRDTAGRNASHSQALQSLSRRENIPLHVLELDVTQDRSVDRALKQVLESAGRLDVVVNNAGVAALGVTEAYTIEQFQQVFDVNVLGVARVNRAALPVMRSQRSGLLIHISSVAGRLVAPCVAVYCASKFALEALADAYRFELTPFGIDSVIIEPGMHRTPILENFIPPADQARVNQYGPAAEYAVRVKSVFEAASHNPETPGPEQVVDAILNLIETPLGKRPFRTVPTVAMQPILDPYNAVADEIRQGVAQMFGVPELLAPQLSASTVT
jgi:NAD(P)-dependent dehydrogenase (short-subunit alcohol dehydrogenase family)